MNKETMTPYLRYLLVADNVLYDSFGKKLSAIGLFKDVRLEKDKTGSISFAVAGEIVVKDINTNEQATITIQILKPYKKEGEEKVLQAVDIKAELKKEGGGIFLFVARFGLLSVNERGEYEIRVLLNGKEVPRYTKDCFFQVVDKE